MIEKCSDIVKSETPRSLVTESLPPASGGRGSALCFTGRGILRIRKQMEAIELDLAFGAIPTKGEGTVEWARKYWSDWKEKSEEFGGLWSQGQAARFLGITNQGLYDLARRGKIRTVQMEHGVFYSGDDCLARREGVRGKPGRPRKVTT
jgi:hypothetical protein